MGRRVNSKLVHDERLYRSPPEWGSRGYYNEWLEEDDDEDEEDDDEEYIEEVDEEDDDDAGGFLETLADLI